ncbi:MAG: pyruvate kinase [Cyanobacteria bacterium REEB65]|nr:pyruvate kinase [Cyanobacteria bacterium REEB65]
MADPREPDFSGPESWRAGLGRKGTKIVATLGPASSDPEIIRRLLLAGVDVFRLNFSHGTHDTHRDNILKIRRVAREEGRTVAILQDIQGPKIRIGEVRGDIVELKAGQAFTLTPKEVEADETRAHVSFPRLAEDIKPGDRVLIDDGLLELRVMAIEADELRCRVVVGGPLRPHKGVNFPGATLKISVMTDKDKVDLQFGAEHGVDWVAASFIQQAQDVLEVKDYLAQFGKRTPIVAKIERREAVAALRDIVLVSDGVMVARGDLGVEIPVEDVPLVQKEIIRCCNLEGKPVITATQMLDSMIHNPRPTRAEASDVANAILDGTDAVMLSNETAAGQYPVEAVEMMTRIVLQTERSIQPVERPELQAHYVRPVQDAIAHAATAMAPELGAAAIITATHSGSSARMVSKYRPSCPVIAASISDQVCRQLALVWGVVPVYVPEMSSVEELFKKSISQASAAGLVEDGDVVVLVAGVPLGMPGTTNMIKVEVVSIVLAHGMGLGQRAVAGIARYFDTPAAAAAKLGEGEILVCDSTDAEWTPAMARAGAIVVRSGGLTSHAAIVGLELGIPVLLSVEDLDKIPAGSTITVDPVRGVVFQGQVRI